MILNEIENIKNFIKGDRNAENLLYNKYKNYVKSYIINNYPKYDDIDDDVSEILIKIFENINNYNSEMSSFKHWIIKIIRNYMIDKWRKKEINYISFDSNIYIINDIDNFNVMIDYNNKINKFEINNFLFKIASDMSKDDYNMLCMKYIFGYKYSEIGEKYNLTSTTVSNRINYLKNKIKKKYNLVFNTIN